MENQPKNAAPDFFARVERIVQAALDAPTRDRIRLIDLHCAGDADLRTAVLRLVEISDASLETFLEGDRSPLMMARVAGSELPGHAATPQRIGRYEIIRKIGEGGMGVVFEAQQDYPHRRVALKVIRSSVPSDGYLRRFRLEADVLGRLQHSGIAHIYDAGAAELTLPDGSTSSQPYLAMEYVDGAPLTEFIRSQSLDQRRKLELFADICDAIDHAHSKGVIHRDLKPGNILVAGDGSPKVLDFGIARLTLPDDQLTTLKTDVGQLIGTLPYMSPEQVEGNGAALDARTDVYALGILLYEILVGRPPFDLGSRTLPDAIRVIRDDEPTRLGRVDTKFRGDLDSITSKAMEKDRDRRYPSAAALAQDIRRYLSDQPVTARPVSTFYQLRKFARRNRAIVIGTATTIVALIGGLIGVGVFASREHTQRLRANQESLEAQRLAYRASIAAAAAAIHGHDLVSANKNLESAPRSLRGWEWNYFHYLANPSAGTFDLRRPVMAYPMACSDTRSVIAYADGLIRVVDNRTGEVLHELNGIPPGLRGTVAISPDGGTLFMISPENEAVALDLKTGRPHWKIADVNCLGAISSSGPEIYLATRSASSIKLVNAENGTVKSSFDFGLNPIEHVNLSPDRKLLAASAGSEVVVSAAATGKQLHSFNAWCWTFSPDSRRVLISGRPCRLIDSRTGQTMPDSPPASATTESAVYRPDGCIIATVESSGPVILREMYTGTALSQFMVPTGVRDFAYTTDSRSLITLSREGILSRWDGDLSPSPFVVPIGRHEECLAAAISPTGDAIAVGGWGVVSLYQTSTGELSWRRPISRQYVTCLTFGDDGRTVVASGASGGIAILDRAEGHQVRLLDIGAKSRVVSIVNHTSSSLLAGCEDGSIIEFSCDRRGNGAALPTLRRAPDQSKIISMAQSNDGRRIAVSFAQPNEKAVSGGGIAVIDTNTWVTAWKLNSAEARAGVMEFAVDGQTLAVAGNDRIVRFLSVSTGKLEGTLSGASAAICCLTMHPSGERIAAACADGSIHIWNMQSRDVVATLNSATDQFHALSFSPDGSALLASDDKNLMVLFETRPPAAGHAARRRILCGRAVAAALFERPGFADDVVSAMEREGDIAPETREAAISFVRTKGDHPNWMNSDAWAICRSPDHTPEEYALALRKARIAVAIFPDDYGVLNTLGIALYRSGQFNESLETLTRSDRRFNAARGHSHPMDLIVMSMIHARQGRTGLAKDGLDAARILTRTHPKVADDNTKSFLYEAEELNP